MSTALPLPLRFRIGARTLFAIRRRLVRLGLSLDEALAGEAPSLPPLGRGDHGYWLTSLRADRRTAFEGRADMIVHVRDRYSRRYADLPQSVDDYMARFSGKTRSTLRRKVRKLARLSGGTIDLRTYRTPAEMAEFHILARALSRKTYQEQLLNAGLPGGKAALRDMRRLAARDAARGWLLFVGDKPVSYLYAPADERTLIYAYLGYDPDFAKYSPGTVLQLEAMREVIEEGRFRRFDFTEGDTRHKRQFANGAVECVDLLLMRPTLVNRGLIAALRGFDGAAALAKKLPGSGLLRRLAG